MASATASNESAFRCTKCWTISIAAPKSTAQMTTARPFEAMTPPPRPGRQTAASSQVKVIAPYAPAWNTLSASGNSLSAAGAGPSEYAMVARTVPKARIHNRTSTAVVDLPSTRREELGTCTAPSVPRRRRFGAVRSSASGGRIARKHCVELGDRFLVQLQVGRGRVRPGVVGVPRPRDGRGHPGLGDRPRQGELRGGDAETTRDPRDARGDLEAPFQILGPEQPLGVGILRRA